MRISYRYALSEVPGIFLGIALAAGCFAIWMYRELSHPLPHARAGEYIEILHGSSVWQVTEELSQDDIIKHAWPLYAYIRLRGLGSSLKAGEYRFPSPISPLGVLRKLQEGQQRLGRFTVIEGWNRWDIAFAMIHIAELKLTDENAALALMENTRLIEDLDPQAKSLEGYLFPDTYNFASNTTPAQVIETMVQRFRQAWKEHIERAVGGKGERLHEVVTVASLIETEAKLNEERPRVASVIYNRLRLNMPLGIDSSVIYAARLAGKWRNDGKLYQSDLDRVSPYNTRKVLGLPPGPIASPGLRSLMAAVAPENTQYIYYVRDPARNDGAHNFYKTETEFAQGVLALRDWERQHNRNDP